MVHGYHKSLFPSVSLSLFSPNIYYYVFPLAVPQLEYCWHSPLSLLILCILHQHLRVRRMLNLNCSWQESKAIENPCKCNVYFQVLLSPTTIIITHHFISAAMPCQTVWAVAMETNFKQAAGSRRVLNKMSLLLLKDRPELSRAVRVSLSQRIILCSFVHPYICLCVQFSETLWSLF